ncbi:glycosyltransferase family 31 protein [Plenodomus tracheiphilus IPT5]|uniref:N-acetylgalactosaminide beta-1,3-galactosyltransferase n=1 Tax=Plenodomus tracheiphilus IPT5 TaxID=1408161 RepID=A0A6A7BE30_9PLEO|nr:glycosyltransferase family 31 protein [Plenodomus tracheiphilus IPT5]
MDGDESHLVADTFYNHTYVLKSQIDRIAEAYGMQRLVPRRVALVRTREVTAFKVGTNDSIQYCMYDWLFVCQKHRDCSIGNLFPKPQDEKTVYEASIDCAPSICTLWAERETRHDVAYRRRTPGSTVSAPFLHRHQLHPLWHLTHGRPLTLLCTLHVQWHFSTRLAVQATLQLPEPGGSRRAATRTWQMRSLRREIFNPHTKALIGRSARRLARPHTTTRVFAPVEAIVAASPSFSLLRNTRPGHFHGRPGAVLRTIIDSNMPHRTFIGRLIFFAVFSVSLVNIFTTVTSASYFHRQPPNHAFVHRRHAEQELVCPRSELVDDVLVVLRTGATEALEKVPVHLRTTLQCVPHVTIVSDMEEQIEGHAVHDMLKDVSEETKRNHDDFKLYNHLQKHGRSGLPSQPVLTSLSGSSKGDYMQTDKPGWALDKWKFLPMIDHALETKPDAKWFVFTEPDTYLELHNLLAYLATFDETKEYYIGKHLYINDIAFAYGGAGFALSAPAMRKIAAQRSTHISEYETFTRDHWVGDCALGKVAEDAQIPLHRAFPHFQGDSPATLDPATEKIQRDLWCYPAITYHHVSPTEIIELWEFEQEWYARHDIVLRHRDIFMELVRPKIGTEVKSWNNMADEQEYNAHDHSTSSNELERDAWKSFSHCRELCESQDKCVQFSFDAGSCGISNTFRLGYARPGDRIQSGWMLDRVDDLFRRLEERCGIRDWFAPEENERSELKMRRRRAL